jgi:hypothetical protein
MVSLDLPCEAVLRLKKSAAACCGVFNLLSALVVIVNALLELDSSAESSSLGQLEGCLQVCCPEEKPHQTYRLWVVILMPLLLQRWVKLGGHYCFVQGKLSRNALSMLAMLYCLGVTAT